MPSPGSSDLEADITPFLDGVARVACAHEGDPLLLLALLRQLEKLHRTIQDGPFRSSLPSERSTLFRLLQDMEQNGGWPYIPRLQLRTFLDLLPTDDHPAHPEAHREGPPDRLPEAA
ncbi:MAG: hypothetical protein ACK6AD_15180 [Cyanobacteriota bacterium]